MYRQELAEKEHARQEWRRILVMNKMCTQYFSALLETKNIKKLQIKLKHLLHSNSVVSTCGMNFWRVIWVRNTAVCESKAVLLYIMEVLGRRGGIAPHPLPLH
jgi:hypothetical protein